MTKLRRVEYCLLRYVPNVVYEVFVNTAAIFIDRLDLENGLCSISCAPDWRTRVLSLDPDADMQMLEALLTEIRRRLLSTCERSDMIHCIDDSFSNVIQISEWRECAVDPDIETIEVFARELFGKTSETSTDLSVTPGAACQV